MAEALVLVVLLIGPTADARLHADIVSRSTSEAFGGDARVLVEARDAVPSDEDAAALATARKGAALAEVAWTDDAHAQAHVHLLIAGDGTWYDRALSFEASDAEEERERAVGYLVAAMVRDTQANAEATAAAPSPPPPRRAAEAPASERPTLPAPSPLRPSRFAIDAAALGALALSGDGAQVGPMVRARFDVARRLALQASGALAFGELRAAGATTTETRLSAGAAYRVYGVRRARSIEVVVALEALALSESVRRADPAAERGRWLAGAHGDVELGWLATSSVEPFLALGAEGLFGAPPIRVDGEQVAQLAPFRATSTVGLRLRF